MISSHHNQYQGGLGVFRLCFTRGKFNKKRETKQRKKGEPPKSFDFLILSFNLRVVFCLNVKQTKNFIWDSCPEVVWDNSL
mmetsp:Transcript_29220/g.40370  ORF Transcript_29220/g.40370 Transcript_29220/m.40370 type:complete len:81 (+) Transcript_29220:188-430(+)